MASIVSDLRKERRDRRIAAKSSTEKTSTLQKLCVRSQEIILLGLAFWGYVKGIADLISPTVSVLGLTVLGLVSISLYLFLKKYPQTWRTGDRTDQISSIPIKGKVVLAFIGLSVIVPRAVDVLYPPPEIHVSLSKSPNQYTPRA